MKKSRVQEGSLMGILKEPMANPVDQSILKAEPITAITEEKNRLDALIVKLCPNGVEYKKLGQIGVFYGGLTGKSKNDFVDGNAFLCRTKMFILIQK